jgi:uncharacterized membrane protein YccC
MHLNGAIKQPDGPIAAAAQGEPARNWHARLAETWPDAVRLLAGAMLAYLLARILSLHETHWAVLTALITARGHAGGTARAGVERLIATVAGAGIAIAAAWLRHAWHLDSGVILFVALAPLCFLVAIKPNYRGAPVAALIVLSAGPAAGMGPFETALLRTGEIALGAIASMIVSAIVFPSRSKAKPRAHAAAVMRLLAQWLRTLVAEDGAFGKHVERLREEIKHELRELTILAHTSGWKKMQDKELERLLKIVSALNADIGFLARAIARRPLAPVVGELRQPTGDVMRSLIVAIEQTGMALTNHAPPAGGDEIDAQLKALGSAAREAADRVESRHAHALIYLLRTVSIDLGIVNASLSPLPSAQEGKS